MRETTVGQLMLERALPPGAYTPGTELNSKNIRQLYAELAQKYPEKYVELSQRLNEIGSNVAYREGTSFDIDSFKTPGVVLEARHRLRRKLNLILKNKTLTSEQKNEKIIEVTNDESNRLLKEIVEVSKDNPLAEQMISGARGNPAALKRLIGGDLLYLNHRDEPIPIVVESSYSEGLKPHEYWAATYGARKGLAEMKLGVGEGGYMAKLLNQISHRLMVTALDSDEEPTTARGLPVDLDDPDNIGALLAENLGSYKRNTVLTPKVVQDLKKTGRDKILIRSPIVGGPSDGGVYARDVGYREYNRLADLGSLPGLTASQALCLSGYTLVRMADWSVKAIKDIEPGEMVLGCSVDGVVKPSRVINVFNNGLRECYRFMFVSQNDNLDVVATLNHRFLVNNYGVKALEDITSKDTVGINDEYRLIDTTHIGLCATYDLEIDHPDHLFLLEGDLPTHNSERLAQTALCLDQDTEVRMADWSIKKIKDIKSGDAVLGADTKGRTFSSKVLTVFDNGFKTCYRFTFTSKDGEESYLVATLDHKVLVYNDGYKIKTLGTLADNDLIGLNKSYLLSRICVGDHQTYDIEVDNKDHLFVSANGLIVSNSAKHSGGVGGTKTIGGFDAIEQMINIPKHYKDGATHAQADGRVKSIEPNPLGGWHIFIGNEDHFVAPGLEPTVKVGDEVEAGDILSEGLPNPSEMVKHKGIGDGSRAFLNEFIKVFKEAGLPAHRRNVELLTRGFINHVELEDDYENWLPGDIAPYSDIEHRWKTRENSQLVKPQSALGKYLETPVLHYTIGTKVRPSVLKNLQDFGIKQVTVNDDPPPFKPVAIRGSASVSYDPNWVTRLLGSNQQKVLLQATRRGDEAEMLDTSYVPAKAQGELFGTSWPKALVKDFK